MGMLEDSRLPQWIRDLLGDDSAWPVLDWDGESWTLDGKSLDDSRDLDDVTQDLGRIEHGENVGAGPGVTEMFGHMAVEELPGTDRVMMVSFGTPRREALQDLIDDWDKWEKVTYPIWQGNPSDPVACYSMLMQHPSTWVVTGSMGPRDPGSWVTSDAAELYVHVSDKGVRLNRGCRLGESEDELGEVALDLELETTAPTFEEALAELARLVDVWYDPSGLERGLERPDYLSALSVDSTVNELSQRALPKEEDRP